jgi:predicted DNA-binding protein
MVETFSIDTTQSKSFVIEEVIEKIWNEKEGILLFSFSFQLFKPQLT